MNHSEIISFGNMPFDIIDGDRGKNYPNQHELLNSGYCLFLSAANVTRNGFSFSTCQFINEQKDLVLRKGKLQLNDIVLTTRGTLGNAAYFNSAISYDRMRINSGMVILRCDEKKISPTYLYNFLRSPSFQNQVRSLKSGVAQPQLPIRDMQHIKMPLPPLVEQIRIASILSTYDDLIENNHRRIQLLEQAAHLLYKEWFVHLRFPGHQQTPITNNLPKGWQRRALGEIARITMGQSPKSEYYNKENNGLPFHQGVSNFGFRFPGHQTYCTSKMRLAEPEDILFSVRAPVGRINITLDRIVLGRGLAAIRSNCGHQNFLFYTLKHIFFKEDIIGSGAIFSAVTKKDMATIEIIQPSDKIASMFMKHTNPIDHQIINLHKATNNLIKARDLLLTKLMPESTMRGSSHVQ